MLEDENQQAAWRRHYIKARKFLMEFVKSHLIFHISKVETAKDMFDTLTNLFERDSTIISISLRTQLHTIKMKRSKYVDYCFTRIA